MTSINPFSEFDRLRKQFEAFLKPLQTEMRTLGASVAESFVTKIDLPKGELPRIPTPPFDLPKLAVPTADISRILSGYLTALESVGNLGRDFTRTYLEQFQDLGRLLTQSITVPEIDWERLRDMWKQGLPANWIDLGPDQDVGEVLELMRTSGWCLVWAPRAEVIKSVLEEQDDEARIKRFLEARQEILADVNRVVDGIESPSLEANVCACRQAIEAFEAGHPEAAQALSASNLSSLINGEPLSLKFRDAKAEFTTDDPMEAPWSSFRLIVVLGMVAQSLEEFFVERGDPVPGRFSRHASAHTVSPQQYRVENSLAALLLVGGFLRELDLLLRAREAEA